MKISTNEEIKKSYLSNNLKAKDVISFLINEGFKTEKEIEKTSLSELDFKGKKIKNVSLNLNYININLKKN